MPRLEMPRFQMRRWITVASGLSVAYFAMASTEFIELSINFQTNLELRDFKIILSIFSCHGFLLDPISR